MFSKSLRGHQLLLLIVFGFITILTGFSVSILGPFYPVIAEEKGVTPTQCGIVFSIYNLTMVILNFIYGKYITTIGVSFMANTGVFILAITNILFGLLDKINSFGVFLSFSIVIRIFEAVGCAAFRISSFCILLNEFEDDQLLVFALIQTFCGVGLTMAPILGSFLFDIGGFLTPFLATGVLLFIGSLVVLCLKPRSETNKKILEKNKKGIYFLLRQPNVNLSIAVTFGAALAVSFIVVNLTLHIISLGIAKDQAGYFHTFNGISYFLGNFIWGKLNGKYIVPQSLWSIGSSLTIIGLLLTGVFSYIFINQGIYICALGLIFYGTGTSAETVSAFSCLLETAYSTGFEKDLSTYGLISNISVTSFALGLFFGPILTGLFYELIGFIWTSLVLIPYHIVLILVTIYFKYRQKKEYEVID